MPSPHRSTWFPIVGFLLGAALVGEDWLLAHVFAQVIRSVLIVLSLTVITGAVHLDGLADTADAFGAGRDRERALDILRDSRVGTFGASAIFFDLTLKILALSTLAGSRRVAALLIAPMLARWAMLFIVATGLPYLRSSAQDRRCSPAAEKAAGLRVSSPLSHSSLRSWLAALSRSQ